MEILISAIAFGFGSLALPFIAVFFWMKKSELALRTPSVAALAFFLAWILQAVVVLLVGESAFLTIPSATFLSAVCLLHVATIFLKKSDSNLESRTTNSSSWLRFYVRLFVLYLPAILIFGAIFGVTSELVGLGINARLSGAIGQLPASLYATYFAFRWLRK